MKKENLLMEFLIYMLENSFSITYLLAFQSGITIIKVVIMLQIYGRLNLFVNCGKGGCSQFYLYFIPQRQETFESKAIKSYKIL